MTWPDAFVTVLSIAAIGAAMVLIAWIKGGRA